MLNTPSNPPNHPLYEIDVTYSKEPCSEYVLYLYLLSVHIQTVVDMKGCKTSFCIHLLIPGYRSGLQGGMHQSDRCYLFKGSTVETNVLYSVFLYLEYFILCYSFLNNSRHKDIKYLLYFYLFVP